MMTKRTQARLPVMWGLVLKWVLATALGYSFGQLLGFIAGVTIGSMLVPVMGESTAALIGVGFVNWAVTGAVLALTQVLMTRQDIDLPYRWALFTALGWTIGNLAGTAIGAPLSQVLAVVWVNSIYLAVLGLFMGLTQWWVIREKLPRASWWIAANIAAWPFALPMVNLILAMAASAGLPLDESMGTLVAGLLSGALVGLLTGIVLNWIVPRPELSEES
jgi:hypothetical protein